MNEGAATRRLSVPFDPARDHFVGDADAEIVLLEYGSYSCTHCHAAHEVIADLRDRFGDRMLYAFHQLPIRGSETAWPAAELAEFSKEAGGDFWKAHDELMRHGPEFADGELDEIAAKFSLDLRSPEFAEARERAAARIDEDRSSARESGARVTPSFIINGRRYEGAWDENALFESMLGSRGHRFLSSALDFVS